MRTRSWLYLMLVGLVGTFAWAQGDLGCPGSNKNKLSCEIPTTFAVANSNLVAIPPTIAAQLSQLPLATAATGTGVIFSGGIPTVSTDTLGSILTERGDTIGRNKFYVSFNYQRFTFDSIDGINLNHFPAALNSGNDTTWVVSNNRIDITNDQFTILGSFGLTDRIDFTVVVPFSKVTLKSQLKNNTSFDYYFCGQGPFQPSDPCAAKGAGNYLSSASAAAYNGGSASGIGDILLNGKANILRLEKSRLAAGLEVRFATGDEYNFLGTGSYGFKPYVVYSRNGRITPHVNFGYQWNSPSALYTDPRTGANKRLPDNFQYSAGADVHITKRVTFVGDLIGQWVLNGPRLKLGNSTVAGFNGATPGSSATPPPQCTSQWSCQTIQTVLEDYSMNNLGVGLKINPVGGLLIFGNALIKLDSAGLRANVVPLVGISYRF